MNSSIARKLKKFCVCCKPVDSDNTAVTCEKYLEGIGRVLGAAGDGGVYLNPLVLVYEKKKKETQQIGKLVI